MDRGNQDEGLLGCLAVLALLSALLLLGVGGSAAELVRSWLARLTEEKVYVPSSEAPPVAPEAPGDGPFVGLRVPGFGIPELSVSNHTEVTLELTLDGPEHVELSVAPGTTERRRVAAGAYRYTAQGEHVQRLEGQERFNLDYQYQWGFSLRPPEEGAPAERSAQDEVANLLSEGKLALDEARHELAMARFRAVLARVPDHDEARYLLGVSSAAVSDYEEARTQLEQVRGGPLLDPAYWSNLGSVYAHFDQVEQAVQCFEKAISMMPADDPRGAEMRRYIEHWK